MWDKGTVQSGSGEALVSDGGMTASERDKFERIKLTSDVERFREIIVQYQSGLAHYRTEIEKHLYTIGRIDERWGD